MIIDDVSLPVSSLVNYRLFFLEHINFVPI